jgi:hypothetical protein
MNLQLVCAVFDANGTHAPRAVADPTGNVQAAPL